MMTGTISMKGKTVSIWLKPHIQRRLDLIAQEWECSRSEAINKLLDERLAFYEELFAIMADHDAFYEYRRKEKDHE